MTDASHMVEELFHRYAPVLFDRCVRILRDRADAEDAVQETFVLVHRHLGSFRYGDSYLPWLYRIASRVCFKVLRTRQRKGLTLDGRTDAAPAPTPRPAEALDAQRQLVALAQSVDERTFQILVGAYLDGMTQDEIADHLGISRRAVVKRLTQFRACFGVAKEGSDA